MTLTPEEIEYRKNKILDQREDDILERGRQRDYDNRFIKKSSMETKGKTSK